MSSRGISRWGVGNWSVVANWGQKERKGVTYCLVGAQHAVPLLISVTLY